MDPVDSEREGTKIPVADNRLVGAIVATVETMDGADEFVVKTFATARGLIGISLIAGAASPATVTSVVCAAVIVLSAASKVAAEGSVAIVARI